MRQKIVFGAIGVFSLLVLLALFGGGYLIRNSKEILLEKAAQSLGRKVSAEHVEVGFWPLEARLTRVVVAADLSSAAAEFLQAKSAAVELRFWPLFLGKLVPRNLVLESPVLTIARDEGNSTGDTSPRRARKRQRQNAIVESKAPPAAPSSPAVWLPFPLQISNGTIRYRNEHSENDLLASHVQLRIRETLSDGPMEVELDAAVTTPTPNLKFKGRIGPIAGLSDYRDIPIDVALQVEALDMGKINRALPTLKKGLPQALQFDGVYGTRDLRVVGSLNNPSIKGTIKGSDASVRFD